VGKPTAFRMAGRTAAGQPWQLLCSPLAPARAGWTHTLTLHLPGLGGDMDWAVAPRRVPASPVAALVLRRNPGGLGWMVPFSTQAAAIQTFCREAKELPSGLAGFDAEFKVLARNFRPGRPAVGQAQAEAFWHWPPGEQEPLAIVGWRDCLGLHLQARLVAPPTRKVVVHFLELGEGCARELPSPFRSTKGPAGLDRLVAKLLQG
jgi:hypothetical protein